jgi:hypothetical protein
VYAKVPLDAGESAQVDVELHADLFAFTGIDYRRIVEPGEIVLGGSGTGTARWGAPRQAAVRPSLQARRRRSTGRLPDSYRAQRSGSRRPEGPVRPALCARLQDEVRVAGRRIERVHKQVAAAAGVAAVLEDRGQRLCGAGR